MPGPKITIIKNEEEKRPAEIQPKNENLGENQLTPIMEVSEKGNGNLLNINMGKN